MSNQELKDLYRKAIRVCHPDRSPAHLRQFMESKAKELNAAYEAKDLTKVRKIAAELGIVDSSPSSMKENIIPPQQYPETPRAKEQENKAEQKNDNAMSWRGAFSAYKDARMAKILLLGFVSGFPWLLIGSMLSLWLKEEGLSRSAIGLFGLAFSVYAVNVLWAPVVDGVRIPFLSVLGKRRSWIILMQTIIGAAMLGLSFLPSAAGALWTAAVLIFTIAAASATQDVAVDALRIELIGKDEPEKVGPGAAMATSGWWLGFGGGKAVALPFVSFLQGAGIAGAWQAGYLALTAVVVLSCVLLIVFIKEKPAQKTGGKILSAPKILQNAANIYAAPVKSFVSQYTLKLALLLLLFIFFFKIGEAFLGRMSIIFYKEIGFSKNEIGLLSGGLGTITVCVFAVLGSGINARYGLYKGIIVGGLAMAATNVLFALLAVWPERWLFGFAVVADQFTTSVSTVAFVAFLSQLCAREYAASQYAALASLGNLSRTTLAAGSGFLIDGLGGNWPVFFLITVLMVSPSLAVLVWKRKQIEPLMR